MIESLVLGGLTHDEDYARRVLPFLKTEYFESQESKNLFELIDFYTQKYNKLPTKDVLRFSVDEGSYTQDQYTQILKDIDSLEYDKENSVDWLADKTEKFCQERAIYLAMQKSLTILDGQDKHLDKGAIPQLLTEALGVSFDSSVGHDYIENSDDRYDFYHRKEEHLPFDIDILNQITKGGVWKKSLTILMAGTGVGKSLAMCHMAATHLMFGKNVLYISLEMAEEQLAQRIDANLMDVTIDELLEMPRDVYEKKIKRIRSKSAGNLVIKEYPTASAGSNHFRHLLHDLKLKKNFIPDIIYVDYVNICASSRFRNNATIRQDSYIKAINEELRGLAQEFNVPVVSATQVNRGGFGDSDPGLEAISESFAMTFTADLFISLISTDELENLNQIMGKQLKNRKNDINKPKRFVIGIDRARMRLYDVEQEAQEDLVDDTPVMNNSETGERVEAENNLTKFKGKFNKQKAWNSFK